MARSSLWPVTFITVLFTGLVLSRSGWLTSRAQASQPRPAEARPLIVKAETMSPEGLAYWANGGTRHWRQCVLQR